MRRVWFKSLHRWRGSVGGRHYALQLNDNGSAMIFNEADPPQERTDGVIVRGRVLGLHLISTKFCVCVLIYRCKQGNEITDFSFSLFCFFFYVRSIIRIGLSKSGAIMQGNIKVRSLCSVFCGILS